jgi:hypothetical protein
VHDVKVMAEEIGLPIRKLSENTSLYLIVGQPKLGNFCLSDWKPNIMLLYSDITSCNSSPERCGGATSFSTLPKKILSVLFVPVICWQEMLVAVKKRHFTPIC